MKDRKVVITFEKDGFLLPVNLAVTGNWILHTGIERNEINNGGHIVMLPGSVEAEAIRNEYELWKTGYTQANKGKEHDPFLPVAVIKTNYFVTKVNNIEEAFVECKVVQYMTERILFTAEARTDIRNKIKEVYSYSPENPRVKRKVFPGDTVEAGRNTEERIMKDSEVSMRGLYLFDPIYTQQRRLQNTNTTGRSNAG